MKKCFEEKNSLAKKDKFNPYKNQNSFHINQYILEKKINERQTRAIRSINKNGKNKNFIESFIFQHFFIKNIILSLFYSYFSSVGSLFLIIIISLNLCHNTMIRHLNYNYNISLTIKGVGNHSILSNNFINYPEKIIINEIEQVYVSSTTYDLTDEINNITLIWHSQISNASHMFEGISNITEIDFSNFDSSIISDASYMFKNCSSLTSINFNIFNTESITKMLGMFQSCSSLISLDLSGFDTSKVTNMDSMFHSCNSLTSLNLISFNTSQVTNMYGMFYSCTLLKSLDLENFETSNVWNMGDMFGSCSNLTSLNLSNFNTFQVKNMFGMFHSCKSLIFLDLSNFITNKTTTMEHMFYSCSSLISLDLRGFYTAQVTNMDSMFYSCNNLTFLDLKSFNTAQVTNMKKMFYSCSSLVSLDISSFKTHNVTNMENMFYLCGSLISIDLRSFNTSQTASTYGMFSFCTSLKSLDLRNFDTSHVWNMGEMFRSCFDLTSLFLNNFNTSSVTSMINMFYECKSLKFLDISSFNTSKVSIMGQMFSKCESLISLNLNNFNTKLINNMCYMFKDCISLKSLCLDNFDTSSVTNMNGMFYNCSSLVSLNLKSFNLKNNKDTGIMFQYCHSLTTLDLSNLKNASPENMYAMFYGCESLISLDLRSFDISLVYDMSSLFYNCKSLISLNLMNFNNFNLSKTINSANMFDNCNKSLRYCINEEKILSNIKSQLNTFTNLNCSDDCFSNSINKFILEKRQCIDNCSNDDYYKYEYESICYHSCPNGTHSLRYNNFLCKEDIICHNYYNYDLTECLDEIPLGYYLNDTNLRTIDKCNIKCLNCTLESNENDLCISCNINESYYPKYNDSSNNNSFINCYKGDIDNYYLDENNGLYMPCYSTCKQCSWKGDEYQNNCTKCYDNYTLNNGNCLEVYNFITNTENSFKTNTEISFNSNTEISFNSNTGKLEVLDNITNIVNTINNSMNMSESDFHSNDSTINSIHIKDSTENINENYNTYYSIDSYFAQENNINSITYNLSLQYNNLSNIPIINNYTIKDIKYYINEFLNSSNISNFTFYYYEIKLNENGIKSNYSNFTFIDFTPDSKNELIKYFNLDIKSDKIYLLIIEHLFNDLNSAVKDFEYKLFLENGTILDINEDFYTDVYLPLIDLISTNYNYSIYFAGQGYDIYNKIDKFYNDKCTPAYLYDNDITIQDRKIDIYPNDLILCKDNCEYKSFNIEEKRIICYCNLNINRNYTKIDKNFLKEETNGNFFNYFLDYINYRILKCYNLLTSFEKIKTNYAFYFSILVINILFWLLGIPKIRKMMNKHIPNFQRVYNDFIREIRRIKRNSNKSLLIPPKKKCIKYKRKNIHNKTYDIKSKISNSLNCKDLDIIDCSNIKINLNNLKIQKAKIIKNDVPEKGNNNNFNELPFTIAIRKDKRNICLIFMSVVIEKLELINLIVGDHKIKVVLIYQYILSLLIDLFLNAFLYTDEVVSNKYHNNGKLDFIVSLTLSLLSNIINSIICTFLNFSKGVKERLEQIMKIIKELSYLYALNKFIKILKIKVMLYFFIELLIICFTSYYITIFCIIYYNSQISLLTNYLMSIIESLILSVIISITIAITRKIGINYLSKNIYNTPKYLYNSF